MDGGLDPLIEPLGASTTFNAPVVQSRDLLVDHLEPLLPLGEGLI
jgi:hypothetical protein